MTTAELASSELRRGPEYRYCIPMTRPVHYRERDLPIEPYTLGALIANGYLSGTTTVLITPDQHVVTRVAKHHKVNAHETPDGACSRFGVLDVRHLTRAMGLDVHSPEKFIPSAYLLASVDQRIALLQGLMDCDGSATGRSGRSVHYHTTSPRLADDVIELVNSLGGTGMTSWIDRPDKKRPEGVVSIVLPEDIPPFSTPAKQMTPGRYKIEPRRAIAVVDRVPDQQIRCITVDASDSLYLIGRSYTVTHNTLLLLNLFHRLILTDPDAKILFISLEQTRGDWFERARRIHCFYDLEANDASTLKFWRDRFYLVDKNRLTVDELHRVLDDFEYRVGQKPTLTAVDYLGYWAASFSGPRYERTSDAVMALKEVAKDRRLRMVTPQQVSRLVMEGAEPGLDAARDAGVIEETADFLCGLWSADDTRGKDVDEASGLLNLKIMKSRHGGKGSIIQFRFAPHTLAIVPMNDSAPGHHLLMQRAQDELLYKRIRDDSDDGLAQWQRTVLRHRGLLPAPGIGSRHMGGRSPVTIPGAGDRPHQSEMGLV